MTETFLLEAEMFFPLLLVFCVFAPHLAGQEKVEDRQQVLQNGIQAFEAHSFEAAEHAFSLLVQLDPSAQSYDYLARAEVADGKFAQAAADFRKSIELGNNSSSAHYNLGLVYIQLSERGLALQEFRRASELDPTSLPAKYALGINLLQSGDAKEAAQVLSDARDQAPNDARLWPALVSAQFQLGAREQAVRTAQDAMRTIPDNSQMAVALAAACLSHDETQAARHLLEDALELWPEDTEIRLLLAKVSLLAEEPAEALAVLRGIPSKQGLPEKLLLSGQALALTGDLDGAVKVLASALKASPDEVQYLTSYAWVLQLQGKYGDAMPILVKAAKLDPTGPAIPYRIGVSHYFLKQYSMTDAFCTKALGLDSQYGAAYFLRGMTKLRQKDFAGAQSDLREAVTLKPNVALFHRELGVAFLLGANLAEASNQLGQAFSLDPENAENYFWRAELSLRRGAPQQSIEDLKRAIQLDPDYSAAYTTLASLYAKVGQPEEAAGVIAKRNRIVAPRTNSGEDRQLLSPQ
jgi:tetratricopeptide (TPR) repeat protein